MDEKLNPTQEALTKYSILVNLDEKVEGLKKEPRRKQPNELRDIYV